MTTDELKDKAYRIRQDILKSLSLGMLFEIGKCANGRIVSEFFGIPH